MFSHGLLRVSTQSVPLLRGRLKAGGGIVQQQQIIMQAIKDKNNFYNKTLQPFANKNRKQMTKAESCLWKFVLRSKQTGVVFNRQRPCLNYIADFMCKELKLIIEVDGYTHLLEEVIINDRVRQANLEKAGFKILRFKDDEVLKEIDIVRNKIFKTMMELQNKN